MATVVGLKAMKSDLSAAATGGRPATGALTRTWPALACASVNLAIVATLFAYRARDRRGPAGDAASATQRFRVPAHPLLPGLFVAAAAFVVYSSVVSNPRNALWGTVLICAGVPAYMAWRRAARNRAD